MKTHNPEINPGYLVRHTFKLDRCDPQQAESARSALLELAGMDQVIIEPEERILKLAYDGSQHNIDELLAIVRQNGLRPRKSWWNRMKLGFARNIDQNVWDNAGYHPSNLKEPPK